MFKTVVGILVVSVTSVVSHYGTEEKLNLSNALPGYDLKGIEQAYRGQDRDMYRPCPVYDLLCIRRYFARHSDCKIAEGPVPNPLYRTQSNLYFPSVNISVTQAEIEIVGLTGTVFEFYVNRKSNLTVLGTSFRDLSLQTRKTTLHYHRKGQEPAVTNTNNTELFPSTTFTTVFKGVEHLRLEDSESVAFLNVMPIIVIGPGAAMHPDPTIPARFAAFLANLYVVVQEAFATATPFYAGTFIQNVICDFGLKLS